MSSQTTNVSGNPDRMNRSNKSNGFNVEFYLNIWKTICSDNKLQDYSKSEEYRIIVRRL